jgi:hypothetical protein
MSTENRSFNRRQALQSLGMIGAGAALTACMPTAIAQMPDIDVDVLNFALNLEYLEAEFYLQAAFGRSLSAADTGGGPAPIGGRKVTFATPAIQAYAEEIALDEEAHVKFLRKALGAKAVARPQIDIGPAFAAAANAAFSTPSAPVTLNPAFDPYANELFFLHGAFIFEDVGVTAYKGAARLITNKDYLEAAAGILGVEAYHAGQIRTLLYAQKDTNIAAYGVTVQTIVQKISDLRASVGGGKDQGLVVGGKANIQPTDADAIAFSRSTSEVLKIVYLGGTTSGGFFPAGLNGNIKTA